MQEKESWLLTKVIICPEIVESALRDNSEDLLMLWMIIKAVDNSFGQGTGLISYKKLLYLSKSLFAESSKSNNSYTRILKGIDKYWRKPSGKYNDKTLGILSKRTVYENLDVITPPVKPFVVSVDDLLNIYNKNSTKFKPGAPTLRSFLIGLVASRHTDDRPLTYGSLQNSTGLSDSTLRRSIDGCRGIIKIPSYVSVGTAPDIVTAKKIIKAKNYFESAKYFITTTNGVIYITRQNGNIYHFPELERISKACRPKELKSYDLSVIGLLKERKYITATKQINQSNTAEEYFVVGGQGKRICGEKKDFWIGNKNCNTKVGELKIC